MGDTAEPLSLLGSPNLVRPRSRARGDPPRGSPSYWVGTNVSSYSLSLPFFLLGAKQLAGGADMLRNAILIAFFGLMVAGCATDRKTETMESSGGTSSTADSSATAGRSSTASSEAAMSSQTMVPTTPADSIRSGSSKNRIAAGVEEETLDSCLQRIPRDATVGQKMLAEQTCRRDFPGRH